MSISPTAIQHVARLARLRLEESEATAFASQLTGILEHFAAMSALDTTDIEPLAHPIETLGRLRDDVVTELVDREAFQACAPAVDDGYYLVPKVIE